MDFLSKKHEYIFFNPSNEKIRVHVKQSRKRKHDIYLEASSKKYRKSADMISNVLSSMEIKFPRIVIIDDDKLGHGNISAYDHQHDIIFYNYQFYSKEKILLTLNDYAFAAQDLSGILKHELGHKYHWDAVKRFYNAQKSRYNLNEAKHILDTKIVSYVSHQLNRDYLYLVKNVSYYASISFINTHTINEIIGEYFVFGSTKDPRLNTLIREEINYGKSKHRS